MKEVMQEQAEAFVQGAPHSLRRHVCGPMAAVWQRPHRLVGGLGWGSVRNKMGRWAGPGS